MTRFSDRYGYTVPKLAQVEAIDAALRNGLLDAALWVFKDCLMRWEFMGLSRDGAVARFWGEVEKRSMLELEKTNRAGFTKYVATLFEQREWYGIYNVVEWLFSVASDPETFEQNVNAALERENAGYRLIAGM